MNRFYLFIILNLVLHFVVSAQFDLNNGSFENKPQDATCPTGWYGCKMGSTPDILPGFWDVYNEPSDGETYIGLITREDGSWESIGQRLPQSVKKGDCYGFSMDLATSKKYEGYNLPIRIRVWAGRTRFAKDQLIGEVDAIKSVDWTTHDFQFYAKQKTNYIILEAYYMKGMMVPYKGNVLVDNITTFIPCIRANSILREELDFFRG